MNLQASLTFLEPGRTGAGLHGALSGLKTDILLYRAKNILFKQLESQVAVKSLT